MGEGKPKMFRGAQMPPKYRNDGKDNPQDKGKPQVPRPYKNAPKGQNSGNGAQSSVSQSIIQGHGIEADYAPEQRHGLEYAMGPSSFNGRGRSQGSCQRKYVCSQNSANCQCRSNLTLSVLSLGSK